MYIKCLSNRLTNGSDGGDFWGNIPSRGKRRFYVSGRVEKKGGEGWGAGPSVARLKSGFLHDCVLYPLKPHFCVFLDRNLLPFMTLFYEAKSGGL